MKHALLALLACASLLIAACGQGGSTSDGASAPLYPTTDVSITAGGPTAFPQSLEQAYQQEVFAGSFSNVTQVTVTVSGEDMFGTPQANLVTTNLGLKGKVWSGSVAGLPIGPTLTFTVNGYSASGAVLFSGAASQVLSSSTKKVGVDLSPVDDGQPFDFPVATSLTVPATVTHGTTASVSLGVSGTPNETLSYVFKPANGSGSFTPSSGTLTLPISGTGTIISTYKAPTKAKTASVTFTLTNSQSNSIQVAFNIVVN